MPPYNDRAMQALYLMALEPVSETTADTRSYGFRKERCTMDAVQQCHNLLNKGYSPMVNLVRYADDFIITSENREVLETETKPLVTEFLAERGLSLS